MTLLTTARMTFYRSPCCVRVILEYRQALGHNGSEKVTFYTKTGLEKRAFKDTTLNY